MKKFWYLAFGALVVFYLFIGHKGRRPVSPRKTSSAKATEPGVAVQRKIPSQTALADIKRKESLLQGEILSSGESLARLVDAAGLDAQELNRRYNSMPEEAFYKSLPADVRDGYKKLHAEIRELQDLALAEDGVSQDFFQKPRPVAPDWVMQHALLLEQQELPGSVARFVEEKARAAEIADEDIRHLADLCSQNWGCIEKSAYLWQKANHRFSERQFQILDQYKKEG